ncbi:MAG: hypothetical protein OXI18_12845 [bacterium]|nr:hypothetical protein [bacterium]
MGDVQLVSADSHVNPPPTMWADNCNQLFGLCVIGGSDRLSKAL